MVWRFLKRTYNRMTLVKNPKPPYTSHVVQIGDSVLRAKALSIHPENIKTKEIQNVRAFGKHFLKILYLHFGLLQDFFIYNPLMRPN